MDDASETPGELRNEDPPPVRPGRRPHLGHRPVTADHAGWAVVMIVLSGLSFALVGVMVRLSGDVPIYEKVFFRSIVMLAAMGVIAIRSRQSPFARSPRIPYLVLRGIFGTTAMFLYFYALERITLADATILNKLSPFFVAVFAVVFLKEKLSRFVVPVLVLAFLGAALVIKPQLDVRAAPAIAGFISAAASGGAYAVVRFLRGKEPPYRIVFYFSLVSAIVSAPPTFMNFCRPEPVQLLPLLGAGVFATTGQLALTLGYHQAPAARISIYVYAHVLFAFVAGLLMWGEMPDVLSIVGSVLIIIAAAYNYRRVLSVDSAPPAG